MSDVIVPIGRGYGPRPRLARCADCHTIHAEGWPCTPTVRRSRFELDGTVTVEDTGRTEAEHNLGGPKQGQLL